MPIMSSDGIRRSMNHHLEGGVALGVLMCRLIMGLCLEDRGINGDLKSDREETDRKDGRR